MKLKSGGHAEEPGRRIARGLVIPISLLITIRLLILVTVSSVRAGSAVRRVTTSSGRGSLGRALEAGAAPLLLAVLYALQETDVGLSSVHGAVEVEGGGLCGLLVLLVEAELGLDGGAVDAEPVETLAGAAGEFHILLATMGVDGERDLEVHAGDELGVGELPDVDVVAGDDTGEGLDVLSDLLDADILGGGLEEHARRGEGQGDRSLEDDDGDE